MRKALPAFAALAAICVLAVLSRQEPGSPLVADPTPRSVPSPVVEALAPLVSRTAVPAGVWSVVTVTEERSALPVAGASVSMVEPRCRSGARIADTDSLGRADLVHAPAPGAALLVAKDGFAPRLVEAMAGSTAVVLARELSYRLRTLDIDDRPLSGIAVAASYCTTPPYSVDDALALWHAAGPDERCIVRHGVSDQNGMIHLRGLVAGTLVLRLLSEDCLIFDGDTHAAIPGTAYGELVIVPLQAVVARVVGDEIVSYEHRLPAQMRSHKRPAGLRPVQQALEARFPGCFVFVAAATAESLRAPGSMQFDLLLAERGWQTFEGPLRRLREWQQPELLDVSSLPEARGLGRLDVVVKDGSDATLPGILSSIRSAGFLAEVWQAAKSGRLPRAVVVPVESGRTVSLPSAGYEVTLAEPLKSLAEMRSVEIRPGRQSTVSLEVKERLAPCRVVLQAPGGSLAGPVALEFAAAGRRVGGAGCNDVRGRTWWLPVGEVLITVECEGYRKCTTSCTITDPDAGGIQELRVELHYAQ